MKILLVSRIDNRDALAFTERSAPCWQRTDGMWSSTAIRHVIVWFEGILLADATADAAIVVGGDGTILRTMQQIDRARSRSRYQLGRGRIPRGS